MTSNERQVNMVAICVARDGCAGQLQTVLQCFVTATRKEAGNISYVLHADLDRPGRFVFYETWRDHAALDAHFEQTEIKALISELEPLVDGPAELMRLSIRD